MGTNYLGNGVPEKKSIEEIYQKGSAANYSTKEKSLGQKIFIAVFFTVLFLALASLSVWGYSKLEKKSQVEKKPSMLSALNPVSEESGLVGENKGDGSEGQKMPEESAEKAVKSPAEIEVNVLNGGAPAGSAGKMKSALEIGGYEKVKAGNSEKSDYLGVAVYYSDELSGEAEALVQAVKDKYSNAVAKKAVTVEEKSSALVVIMGK